MTHHRNHEGTALRLRPEFNLIQTARHHKRFAAKVLREAGNRSLAHHRDSINAFKTGHSSRGSFRELLINIRPCDKNNALPVWHCFLKIDDRLRSLHRVERNEDIRRFTIEPMGRPRLNAGFTKNPDNPIGRH